MILEEKNTNSFSTSKAFETSNFGIKSENLKHLVDLISKGIYSNKPLAVIREVSCNAMDSHVAAGKPLTPIRITLPSRFSQNFTVRDFGKGLTHDEMTEIYTSYGASTKRDSDTQVGAFGLGSKSPFCLSDSFNVNSYQKGKKSSYTCVLDATNVGTLIHTGTFTTHERDGLEVIVSIDSGDIDSFSNEAKKFFKYWTVMPEIEGFTTADYDVIRGADKVISEGTGWQLMNINGDGHRSYNRGQAIALMGNIAYPIQWDSVKGYADLMTKHKTMVGSNLDYFIKESAFIFRFNIGEVKMAPSREALQYTDLTNKSIINRLDVLLGEITIDIQAKISNASNLWNAKMLYNELFDGYNGLHRLRGVIKVKFGGKEIIDNQLVGFDANKNPDVFKTYYRRGSNTSFYGYDAKSHGWNCIECAGSKMILEIDQANKVYIQKAVQYLSVKNTKINTVYTLTFKDAAQRKEVFDAVGLDDSFIIKYSTIADAVKNTIVRNVNGNVSTVKKDTTVRNVRAITSTNVAIKRDINNYWSLNDLPNVDVDMVAGGIYIETDKKEIKSKYGLNSIQALINTMARSENSQIIVHFIGQNLMNGKLMQQGKWIEFDTYMKGIAAKIMKAKPELSLEIAMRSVMNTNNKYSLTTGLTNMLINAKINKDLTQYAELLTDKFMEIRSLVAPHFSPTDADIKTIKDLYTRIMTQFPMLPVLDRAYYNGLSSSNEKIVIDYLKEKAV